MNKYLKHRIHSKLRQHWATRIAVFLFLLILGNNCEFPYETPFAESEGFMVIEGGIVKEDTLQTIRISLSATLQNPDFNPVDNCEVILLDESGQEFAFSPVGQGRYQAAILPEELEFNSSYLLRVISSSGKVYESDMEKLQPAADVDSIYFEKEEIRMEDNTLESINQFYIDLRGTEEESRNYRWKLTETYEYNSRLTVDMILENEGQDSIFVFNRDSLFRCWKSMKPSAIYTTSTESQSDNTKRKVPLHRVYTASEIFNVKYSLLVEQYSLSNKAFEFWNQIYIESGENGDLYTHQPGQAKSNIRCTTDEDEQVLGFFWVSSVKRKRIFVKSIATSLYRDNSCDLVAVDEDTNFDSWPIYLHFVPDGGPVYTTRDQSCMNCLLRGGANIKPHYWDNESYVTLLN